jgi:hypothetical protein
MDALFHKAGRISRCFEVAAKKAAMLDHSFPFSHGG